MPEPAVAIPLPSNKKAAVHWGSVALMLSVSMFGLSLATLQEPILRQLDSLGSFSLLSILSILGLAIMTPIGGKLGDLYGRRTLVLIAGAVSAICVIGMALVRSLLPFLLLRFLFGAAQGAFSSAPYILLREINKSDDLPKALGALASAVAAGGFLGSLIAGILSDLGYLAAAIAFPLLPLLLGIGLIAYGLPMQSGKSVSLDFGGVAALTIGLSAALLALNSIPDRGFLDPLVLLGLGLGAAALLLLFFLEQKAKEPLIPLRLFRNRQYRVLLALGFCLTFYTTAMNYYAPLAVMEGLGLGASVSGSLQLPRTILTLILPSFCGIWLSKAPRRSWQAMALSAALLSIAFLVLGLWSSSLLLLYTMLALTGVAESFRAVSLMPAAQATLEIHDLGIGSSLLGFANSLSNLLASLFFGLVYDLSDSVSPVFLLAGVVSFLALALVFLFIRPRKQWD